MAIGIRVTFVTVVLSSSLLKISKSLPVIQDTGYPSSISTRVLTENYSIASLIATSIFGYGPWVWTKDGDVLMNSSEIVPANFKPNSHIILPVNGRPNLEFVLIINDRASRFIKTNLRISCPQTSDAGVYTLYAQGTTNSWENKTYIVNVTSQPDNLCPFISSTQKRYGTFTKGCPFTLTCHLTDRTGVTTTWRRQAPSGAGSTMPVPQHDGNTTIEVDLSDEGNWACRADRNGTIKNSNIWTWKWKREQLLPHPQPPIEEAPSIDAVDETLGRRRTRLNSGASVRLSTNVSLSCNHCSKSQVSSWTKNTVALTAQTNRFWLLKVDNESDIGNFSCKIQYPGSNTYGVASDTFKLLFNDKPPDPPGKCEPPGEPVDSLAPFGGAITALVVVVVGTMVVLRFFICLCCCSNAGRADAKSRGSSKVRRWDRSTMGTEEPGEEEEEEDKSSSKQIPLITEEMKKHYDEWRARPPAERSLSVPSDRGASLTSTEIGYYVTSRYA